MADPKPINPKVQAALDDLQRAYKANPRKAPQPEPDRKPALPTAISKPSAPAKSLTINHGPQLLGDLPLFKQIAAAAHITPSAAELIEIGTAIQQHPATIDNAAYMHVVLCHIGMPRSRQKGRVFERRYDRPNFRYALRIEAGSLWNGKEFQEHPLPFGTKPRLVLLDLLTTAIRTKSRFVDAGHSQRDYMMRIGIDPQGSEYRSFKTQTSALAATRMKLGMTYPTGRILDIDTKPIKTFEAWLAPPSGTQQTLWPGVFELSPDFYDGLAGALVPVDERAAFALDGALEMDIYFWLAQRLCRITDPKGQFITWHAIKEQFAPEYKHLRSFKQEFLKALKQVLLVYRDARVDPEKDPSGIWLNPSKPPIPKTSVPVLPR